MAIDLKDQTFGVEIEFTGITRERAAQILTTQIKSLYQN